MDDRHTHEFPQLMTASGTPVLFPCRVCQQPASAIIATLVTERDARLGQVYDALDAVAAILTTRATRSTPKARRKPRRTRRARRRT